MNAKTYILRTALYTIIAALVVLALNYTVDPYGITGAPRVTHFNEYKVDINNHTRLLKRYQPQFQEFNTLVIGNSRVEMGIDPAHSCFGHSGLDVYNLGMPGADVGTQLAYALNVIYQQPIVAVYLSVDFIDFISTEPDPAPTATLLQHATGELKLLPSGERNPGYHKVVFLDFFKSLFSLDAFISSVKTIVLQRTAAADRDEMGFNPARDFDEAIRIEGPRALFDQKMQNLQAKYGASWHLRNSDGELPATFDELNDFLTIAAARDIEVHLFTHPFHQSYWELMRDQGLMPLYEDWMKSLETLVREREDDSLTFWDFSGDSAYIHESVPDAGVRSGPLQWFWEPAHYRRELGDLMVNTMMSQKCGKQPRFGRRIL